MSKQQTELEKRLRKTLSFYLKTLPDEPSRDFMIKLIIRDFDKEISEYFMPELNKDENSFGL